VLSLSSHGRTYFVVWHSRLDKSSDKGPSTRAILRTNWCTICCQRCPGIDFMICFTEMCLPTIVIGVRRRIGSLSGLSANRAWNRTQIRTRVDGP
jgi:hypothetical protein